MEVYEQLFRKFIEIGGAPAALVAGAIVGLGLLVIVYARTAGLFAATRSDEQKGDLLDHFSEEVGRLAGDVQALRRDLGRSRAEQDRLKDRQRELVTKVELMRAALRRAVELLRDVREGRVSPDAISAIDTVEPSL